LNDALVEALQDGSLNFSNIDFRSVRRIGGKDHGIFQQIGRGRNVYSDIKELEQYLFSYGLMIKSQWENLLPDALLPHGKFNIIDYGCGQGLGTLLVAEEIRKESSRGVSRCVLIEPSSVALRRATEITKCCLPMAEIVVLEKTLDDVVKNDLVLPDHFSKLHILSNVLDLECINVDSLFNLIFSGAGSHYILAVSHNRDFAGGSENFSHFQKSIKTQYPAAYITSKTFMCGSNMNMDAILLRAHVFL